MTGVRFLLDENITAKLYRALQSRSPGRDIVRVGAGATPAFGSSDEQLLAWCEENDRVLVTLDKATMLGHFMKHLASGRHSPGVLIVRKAAALVSVIQILVLILEASYSDDWCDQIRYIPL